MVQTLVTEETPIDSGRAQPGIAYASEIRPAQRVLGGFEVIEPRQPHRQRSLLFKSGSMGSGCQVVFHGVPARFPSLAWPPRR